MSTAGPCGSPATATAANSSAADAPLSEALAFTKARGWSSSPPEGNSAANAGTVIMLAVSATPPASKASGQRRLFKVGYTISTLPESCSPHTLHILQLFATRSSGPMSKLP